jgi:hypothetical protein
MIGAALSPAVASVRMRQSAGGTGLAAIGRVFSGAAPILPGVIGGPSALPG